MTKPGLMSVTRCATGFCFVVLLSLAAARAQEPVIAPASDEGRLAIQGFKVPPGVTTTLVAAEPDLANPVAFCFDERGRILVAETFRQEHGVVDNRGHMNWLEDDLALQTVEQRGDMFRRFLGDEVRDWSNYQDRIRRLEDRDGDGRFETATVFAGGFNDILDGTGAGVITRRGRVYYTCIPNLWQLEDKDDDGHADDRTILHHGYGVRVAFRGHDMHGLIWGPDGRLYFSIGDRGYNVETQEGTQLKRPETGAVFRCEPDGSKLEVFAVGLRNPQELAFNDEGDLFTGDNNSDGGDRARWVYVVPHGDTGWRMYYQYLSDRGPWNRERMWHPYRNDEQTAAVQPAFLVPPILNVADGPSGVTFDPGVGLPPEHRGRFFLADFRGAPGASGVRSFRMIPKGAGYELADSEWFVQSLLATDVDFGPDGGIYALDWVDGWNGSGKGRIYRFDIDQQVPPTPTLGELLKSGFESLSDDALLAHLGHSDRRVRLEAQYELADRASISVSGSDGDALARRLFELALSSHEPAVARHAVWAIGQIVRRTGHQVGSFAALANHSSPEVRRQALRIAADFPKGVFNGQAGWSVDPLVAALADENVRIRFEAALALGRHGDACHLDPLLAVLAENKDEDAFLRHAASVALAGVADADALLTKANHGSAAARLGLVLALRRLASPELARFLSDPDFVVAAEAGRAIHDLGITEALPQLARQIQNPGLPHIATSAAGLEYARRILNANFRLGGAEAADVLAVVAAGDDWPDSLRIEAAADLVDWANPPRLDRVTGEFRPVASRSVEEARPAAKRILPGLLGGSKELRESAVKLASAYAITDVGPQLVELARDRESEVLLRVQAIAAMLQLKEQSLADLARELASDPEPRVRAEARRASAVLAPEAAVPLLANVLSHSDAAVVELQSAIQTLAGLRLPAADAVLEGALVHWSEGDPPQPEIELELLEAATERGTPRLKELAEAVSSRRPADNSVAAFSECLSGGDAERGRRLFFGSAAASCRRCHKINGDGSDVGPDLSEVGKLKARDYLLEAIVNPNARIAEGFETAVFAMDDGLVHSGIVKHEDDAKFLIVTPTGEQIQVEKAHIEERAKGQSGMPADVIKQVSRRDLRDLVEFLTTLKEKRESAGH